MKAKKQQKTPGGKNIQEIAPSPGKDRLMRFLKILGACAIVFALAFCVYAKTLGSDFIWDDEYLILNNSQVKSFSHFWNTFKTYVGYGSENINNFYRPFQEISNMIDWNIWKENAFGFHLTNNVLHAAVGALVVVMVYMLSGSIMVGFFSGLLFSIHPIHTEAVAYIAGRADSLYSVFMLLAFISFMKFVKTFREKPLAACALYALSLILFTCSLLSKEMVVSFPLIVFLYVFFFVKGSENDHLYPKLKLTWIPFFAVILVYGLLRMTVLDFSKIAPPSYFDQIPFIFRIATSLRAMATYFRILLLPVDLHMERTLPITESIFDIEAYLAILVLGVVVWLGVKSYRAGSRVIPFSIAWFFANLLPVSNIIPINSFIAEHWIYMASVGIFILCGIALTWLWKHIPRRGKSLKIGFVLFAAIVAFSYGDATFLKTDDWKTEENFFRSTLLYHPTNARLYLNLGNTYYEKGEVDKAVEQYMKCLSINKGYAVAYGNIGSAYLHKGNYDKGAEFLKTAVKLQPNYPIAHYNLGIIYYERSDMDEAEKELKTAVGQLPQLYQAWNLLGRAYLKMNRVNDARNALQTSLKILPGQREIQELLSKLN